MNILDIFIFQKIKILNNVGQNKEVNETNKTDGPFYLTCLIDDQQGPLFLLALLAVITFTFFTNILSLLGDHGNPVTTIQEKYHQAPQLYNLLPQNFTIQLGLQDQTGSGYIDESIYIIEANWVRKSKNKSLSNIIPIPLVRCDINSFKQKELQSYFLSQDYANNYCIDWDQINFLSLEGAWDSDAFQYLAFSLKMCTELTQQKTQCRPLNEVQKLLKHNFFNLQISDNIIDLSDYNNPFQPKGQDTYTTVSSQIFKQLTFYLQPVSTLTDQGIISSQFDYQSTLKFNNPLEMIDLNDGEKILDLIIRLDYVENLNIRIYPKLQQILAEVGGLWNVLYTVTLFLQLPFKKLAYKLQIMNSLFNYETGDQNYNITLVDQQKTRTQLQTDQIDNKNIFLQIPSNRSVQLNPSAKQRLQSIMIKSQKLNDTKNFSISEKKQLSQQISHSIKSFFSTVKQKLKLNLIDYIFFLKFSSEKKRFQYEYSQKKLEKSLDILYIINKLHEIDKLKMILLTQDQIKLFDYLPKPVIKDCYTSQQSLNIYYPLLEPHKSQYQKANEAQSAFSEISKNIDDPINKQLINCIDQSILEFLKLKFNCEPTINQEQISRSINSQMELVEPLNQ